MRVTCCSLLIYYLIKTCPAIETRERCTLVNFQRTMVAKKTRSADASVAVSSVSARGAITTGIYHAVIDVNCAVWASKSINTGTSVITNFVNASSIIVAWGAGTLIDINATVFSCVSLLTSAPIVIYKINASSTIYARVLCTVIHV